MLRLFQHIRKSLLAERDLTKYLQYALGEILLVVIGILLALSINNWNEERKTRSAEQALLKDLKIEMNANIEALQVTIDAHQNSLNAAQEVMRLVFNSDALQRIPDSKIDSLIYGQMTAYWNYDPRRGIRNSIFSSGKINYLSSKELRYRLASIDDITANALDFTTRITDQSPDLLYPSFAKNFTRNEEGYLSYQPKRMFEVPEFILAVRRLFIDNRRQGLKAEKALKEELVETMDLIESLIE